MENLSEGLDIEVTLRLDASGNPTLSGDINPNLSAPPRGYFVKRNLDQELAYEAIQRGYRPGEKVRVHVEYVDQNGA